MKVLLPIALCALVIGAGLLAGPPAVHAVNQTWTGAISTNHCGLSHPAGESPRDCTLACVEGGAAFVLVSGEHVFTFANQTDPRLRAHAGATVTVTGDLHGHVLTAATIAAGPRP